MCIRDSTYACARAHSVCARVCVCVFSVFYVIYLIYINIFLKVNWDKELEEEAEKARRKKREAKSSTVLFILLVI